MEHCGPCRRISRPHHLCKVWQLLRPEGWLGIQAGALGLGYYQDGISEKRHVDLFKAVWPTFDAKPVELQLDKCVRSEIVGDLRTATLADDSVNKTRVDERKAKRAKSRYTVSKAHGDAVMAKKTTTIDTSHRDVGLWAIDTANPNAWWGNCGVSGQLRD